MALDLSELKFVVNDSDLKRASETIGDLVVNVSKLDKAARDAAQTEAVLARAAKLNADANLQNAKAQDVRLKSTIAADKADQAAEKAVEKRTKAIERSSAATKKNADILQLQSDTYEFILEGFSKGDAKVLAMAKSTGQLSESLKKVLTDIRQFSKNTFDQTETGLDRMTKAAKESTIAQSFLNEGFNLTSKQARELSNDLDRLNIRLQHQGKSYQEIVQAQAVYKQQFIDEANAVNRANYALAAVEKQRKDVVTATNYLTQADQKMAAALNISNAALDKSGTDSLVKYEMALRKSGLAQDVVTQKLATYKSQLAQVQAQEAKRAEQNLTRAISPQLMDIGVSLYSGQNPLTVLIQQSGQLVDLFQLSGVEANKLGEAMRNSFYSMVPAIGTVAKGLSSLFFGMFLDAGKSITSFIGNVTGMNKVLQHTDDILYLVGGRATWFSKALATVSTIAAATFGTGIFAIVAGLTALAVGLKQVITENNDLAKAFALSGGSIGASHTQVLGYVKTLAEAGATTGQATEALIAMAKAGVFTSDEILLVSNSAIQMQQGFGIAVEDTVKQFAKLKEKPVESLLEIAKSAGQVSPEIIKMVQELDKAGKSSDAAALAMKAYADSNSASFKQMRENYNGFALFVIDLGKKIKQFFSDTFKTLFIATDPNQQLEEQLGKVRDRIKEVSGNLQRLGSFGDPKLLNSLKEQERSLISQIGANVRLAGEEERRKLNNIENAKQLEFAAGIEKQLSDIQDNRAKKSMTLSEFQNKYVEDAIKKANATLKLDKEKINLTETQIAQLKEAAKLEWQEANKSKKGTSENYYESLMREATNNTLAAANATEELTKSEKKLLEVLSDSRFSKLTKQQKEDVVAKYEAAIVVEKQTALTEKLAQAEEHRLKLLGKSEGIGKQYYSDMQKLEEFAKVAGWSRTEIEELTRAIFKSTPAWKAYEKALDDVGKAARKFEEDSIASQAAINNENQELDFRISLLGKTAEEQRLLTREYEKETKLRQVQTQLAKKLREIEVEITQAKEKGLVESDYKELIDARVQAQKDAADKTSSIYKETAVKFREDFDAEVQKVKSGLTDSIVTALFEGGKAGSKKLRDVLVNTLRQKVTIVVDAVVNTLLGNVVGGLLGSGADSAAGSAAGSAGSSILGSIGGNLFGKAITGSAGSFLGAGSFTGMLSNMWSGITTGFSTLFTKGIGAWFSQGTGLMSAGSVGGGLGALAGPISAALLLATNWKKLFGRTLKDSGIQGEFGGDTGFEGQQYKFYKGGLFRSDKTELSPLDEAVRKTFADSFIAMKKQVVDFANVLGLSANKLEGFSSSIKLSLKGLSEEDANKKIQEALATTNNELAQQLLGTWTTTSEEVSRTISENIGGYGENADIIFSQVNETVTKSTYTASEYAKENEKAIDTLSRLATSLTTVNGTFEKLGLKLQDVSLAGANAASNLVELLGGLDAFNQKFGAYYENFYSEEEKRANVIKDITKTLREAGAQVTEKDVGKATREQFRAIYESIVKVNGAASPVAVAMINVAGAFASITQASETATTTTENVTAAENKLEESRQDQIKTINQQLSLEKELYTLTNNEVALRDTISKQREIELQEMDAYSAALQRQIWAITDAKSVVDKAYSNLEKSVAAEKKTLTSKYEAEKAALNASKDAAQAASRAQIESAQKASDAIKDIANDLLAAVKKTQIQSDAYTFDRLNAARNLIQQAADTNNIKMPGLEDALSTASEDSQQFYSTFEDYAFAQGVTNGNISKLSTSAEQQLSAQEQIVLSLQLNEEATQRRYDDEMKALEERYQNEMDQLDLQLELSQKLIDEAMGINTSVLSVKDAVLALQGALAGLAAAMQSARSGGGGGAVGGGGGGGSSGRPSGSASKPDINGSFYSGELRANDFVFGQGLSGGIPELTTAQKEAFALFSQGVQAGGTNTNGIVGYNLNALKEYAAANNMSFVSDLISGAGRGGVSDPASIFKAIAGGGTREGYNSNNSLSLLGNLGSYYVPNADGTGAYGVKSSLTAQDLARIAGSSDIVGSALSSLYGTIQPYTEFATGKDISNGAVATVSGVTQQLIDLGILTKDPLTGQWQNSISGLGNPVEMLGGSLSQDVVDQLTSMDVPQAIYQGTNYGGQGTQNYTNTDVSNAITSALGQGFSITDIISGAGSNFGLSESQVREAAQLAGIPGFADGGAYQGGLAMVGEEGPELINFKRPGMVYNNAQTMDLMNSQAIVVAIEKLGARLDMIEANSRATAVASTKTSKALDRTIPEGDYLNVKLVT